MRASRSDSFVVPAAMALAIMLSGVMAGAPGLSAPARAATAEVTIADFAFSPATLTIAVGDTVTWTNTDAVAHTATSTSGAFDSDLLDQGESFSFTFTAPGTYDYRCTPHPQMTGRIVVEPAAAPSTPASQAPVGGTSPPPADGGSLPDAAVPGPAGAAGSPLVVLGLAAIAVALLGRRLPRTGDRSRASGAASDSTFLDDA